MTLLLDQNVSHRLKHLLRDIFPDLKHVTDVGLTNCTDREIIGYADKSQSCIITFDNDFVDLVTLHKSKVKIIWLRTGNTSTIALADLLRIHENLVRDFLTNVETQFLEIG
jgi:predicted nuclease of predicted toxin-antitoxin system